jgi:hypothetical protein
VEVSYLTPLPFFLELVGSVGQASGRSFLGDEHHDEESEEAEAHGIEGPEDLLYTLAARAFFELSPNWSLLSGLSFMVGPNGTGSDTQTGVYAVDLYLKYRPITRQSSTVVELQTEWFHRQRQVPGSMLWDISGYAHAQWRFSRRWAVAARYELGTPTRNRDGDRELDDLDPDWTENRHRGATSLTFFPTEFSRLRLQGSLDYPAWQDDPIVAVFLAGEVVVGAHGAHKF